MAARRKPGETVQATDLLHEAYLRLLDNEDSDWNGRSHFFGAAAQAMLRILIDQARRKKRLKHGGGRERITLDESEIAVRTNDVDLDGHDDVLITATDRFRDNIREVDVLARFGGDEFALLASETDGEAEAVEAARRLVSCLAPPIELDEGRIQASVSIGLAIRSVRDRGPDQLLNRADQALYRAKGRGRNQFSL